MGTMVSVYRHSSTQIIYVFVNTQAHTYTICTAVTRSVTHTLLASIVLGIKIDALSAHTLYTLHNPSFVSM